MNYRLDSLASIPEAFFELTTAKPERVACRQAKLEAGEVTSWQCLVFRELRERVAKVATFLKSAGLMRGDRVAIISNTRPEWLIADLAILCAGGVVVSVYHSLTAQDVGYIIYDSGAKFAFAENEEQVEKLRVLLRNPCAIPATEDRVAIEARLELTKIVSFEDVASDDRTIALSRIEKEYQAEFSYDKSIGRDDLASLVYTSGTTGPAKGVMQTHGNHLSNVRQAHEAEIFDDSTTIFLLLPLAHSFAKLMGYIGFLWGVELRFPAVASTKSSKADPALVLRDLRGADCQVVPMVPRLLEKMKDALQRRSRGRGISAALLALTLQNAERRYESIRRQQALLWGTRLLWALCGPIRARIRRELFGRNFQYCVTGGAKLPVPLCEFFEALAITLYEGYGLTETCVATNVNRPTRRKIGTVGPVLSNDIKVRIAEDGEVLFRGPNVAKGYFGRLAATKAAWGEQGWFHTGDLGTLDAEGFLSIVGRKKELIVTSNGKKIAPERIEALLQKCPLVSHVMLWGEGRQYCVALFTLNKEGLALWAQTQGSDLKGAAHEDQTVQQVIRDHVEKVNHDLADFESVKRFFIAPEDLSIENSLLTPTLKVRRQQVYQRYKQQIDGLYA